MPSWEITEHPLIAIARIIDMNCINRPGGVIFIWNLTLLTPIRMPGGQAHILILVNNYVMTLINSMVCSVIVYPERACKSRCA
jgi:hypothetical protein